MSRYCQPNKPIPEALEPTTNLRYNYHRDKLYRLLYTLFDFVNLPETWSNNYIKEGLFDIGYMGFFRNTIAGDLPIISAIHSYDYRYQPATLMYTNWVLGEGYGYLGIDAEMLYINYQYKPLLDIVCYYASLLANIDASISTNLYNTRVSNLFAADTESEKQTIQKMYDNISEGNPMVLVTKNTIEKLNDRIIDLNNAKNTFVGDLLNELYRSIINRFLSDIGIPNTPYEKKERLISSEADSNNAEVKGTRDLMMTNLREGISRINKMFGTKIRVVSNYNREVMYNVVSDDIAGNAGGIKL